VAVARTQRNLERIERLVADAEAVTPSDYKAWVQRARLAVAAVYGDPSPQLERFDDIRYGLIMWTDLTPDHAWHQAAMSGVREALGELKAIAEDIRAHIEPVDIAGPDPAAFHPWVVDAAGRLWQDGHRRQAVQSAASAVETWLRTKVDAHGGSISSIVATAFSTKPPEPGAPRLRFTDIGPEGSDVWKNAHEGAGAFGRGCFMRIRNLYTHNDGADEHADIEALASLSLLARWIDAAAVERADD
jgi:hypothetical protein